MSEVNSIQNSVQVNPADVARNTLNFLARASFTRNERTAFDQCEALLVAMVNGSLIVSEPQRAQVAPPPAPVQKATGPKKERKPRRPNGHARTAVNGSGEWEHEADTQTSIL